MEPIPDLDLLPHHTNRFDLAKATIGDDILVERGKNRTIHSTFSRSKL